MRYVYDKETDSLVEKDGPRAAKADAPVHGLPHGAIPLGMLYLVPAECQECSSRGQTVH